MTTAERIRRIKILETLEKVGEKTEDGKLVLKENGNILIEGEMKNKEEF